MLAFRDRKGGEGEFQVTHADAAETSEKVIGEAGNQDSGGAGKDAGENAQAVDEEPGDDEFEGLAESGPGGGLGVGLACLRQGSSLVDGGLGSRKNDERVT